MRVGRLVSGLAVLGAFAACSLVTSLDGLSDPPRPPPEDGGVPDSAGPAGTEGGAVSPSEAGVVEAGPGDSGYGPPFCSLQVPAPPFCADFEEGETTFAFRNGAVVEISAPDTSPGCDARVAGSGRASAGSFVATTKVANTGDGVHVYLNEPVEIDATKGATLQWAMRFPPSLSANEIDFVELILRSGDIESHAYLVRDKSGGSYISLDGVGESDTATVALPADAAWHDYKLAIDVAPLRSSLVIDGNLASSIGLPSTMTPTTATFLLGPSVSAPAAPVELAYDDIVLTTR